MRVDPVEILSRAQRLIVDSRSTRTGQESEFGMAIKIKVEILQ